MRHLIALLACTPAFAADTIFDDPEEQLAKPHITRSPETQPALFVLDATSATIAQKLEAAVRTVSAAADAAGARGETLVYEKLTARKLDFMRSLDALRNQPMLPSIYPLSLGRRGCLYAIRETTTIIPAGEERLRIPLQSVTWFKVKIGQQHGDGSFAGEVLDADGGKRLYKVRLFEAGTLRAGTTVQFFNVGFECLTEEIEKDGNVYHLRKIPASELLPGE